MKFAHYWQKKCDFAIVMDKILKVHSVNDYALFIGDEELEELSYGQICYTLNQHSVMCVVPGQIGGKNLEHPRYNGGKGCVSKHSYIYKNNGFTDLTD